MTSRRSQVQISSWPASVDVRQRAHPMASRKRISKLAPRVGRLPWACGCARGPCDVPRAAKGPGAIQGAAEPGLRSGPRRAPNPYLRCFATIAVISNIDTCLLPPKMGLSLSSELIMRLLTESWSLFFLT